MSISGALRFFRAMYVTMRPYLLFLSGITGAAGLAVAGAGDVTTVSIVFVASFLSYGFGQALTDCFQTDTDALSAPYRPLIQGTVSTRQVLIVSVFGLALCSGIFALLNIWNLLLGAVAVAGLATYTWFKRRWWGGPWYNAWIVVLLCLMAYKAGVGEETRIPPALPALLVTVFFGYANFVLAGYFKDIEADRATGYNTFPVVFGRRRAALVSHVLAAGTVAGLALTLTRIPGTWYATTAVVFPIGFAGWGLRHSCRGQLLLWQNTNDVEAHRAIRSVVETYVLFLGAAVTALRPAWGPAVLTLYILFLVTMSSRVERSQI